jgi:hypothetical protein
VVDDAVRFALEKAKASTVAIENKEKKIEGIDIQRSEEEGKQSTTTAATTAATTTNQLS